MAEKKSDDIPIEIVEETTLFKGKWLAARQVIYRHRDGSQSAQETTDLSKLPCWQIAYRSSKPQGAKVDGVSIIAKLTKTNPANGEKEKFLVLVKQFRVPIMKYSLEFPAGLLDGGESSVEAGLRELKEETGYTATKVVGSTSGVQTLDPGFSDDSINFLVVEIDGDTPENAEKVRKQKLDDDERIEVILVPVAQMLDEFRRMTEEGIYVEAMVYSFALGEALSSSMNVKI